MELGALIPLGDIGGDPAVVTTMRRRLKLWATTFWKRPTMCWG